MLTTYTTYDDESVRFMVEGYTHNLYEVRFMRLNFKGDFSPIAYMLEDLQPEDEEDEN